MNKSQATENMSNKVRTLSLTGNIQKCHITSAMVKAKTQPKPLQKVALVPTDEENAILEAGMKKHGLKKAVDVVRMALRRFAEIEKLELKAS